MMSHNRTSVTVESRHSLPPITTIEVRKTLRTFSKGTAVGADGWRPCDLQLLCDKSIGVLINILNIAERAGYPLGDVVDIVFLDKPGGGERPIGLSGTLYRVWARCRRKYARAWERHHARDYFWASEGKSSEDAAHYQGVQIDLARAKESTALAYLLASSRRTNTSSMRDC